MLRKSFARFLLVNPWSNHGYWSRDKWKNEANRLNEIRNVQRGLKNQGESWRSFENHGRYSKKWRVKILETQIKC